ncbi:DUF72 domain-containing protein [bacterium]|nr:DUF72 domain-containing protein [bacterium]
MNNILVGTAGWRYDDWQGIVYPADRSKNFQELTFISQLFDVAEVNSTFYYPPRHNIVEGWVKKTENNSAFKFTAKLWQRLTHDLSPFSNADVSTFIDGIIPLSESQKLGALLAQFPWRFKNGEKERGHLARIMDAFASFPLVIEFRHASWDNKATLNFLGERGVGIAAVDQPVIGRSIEPQALSCGNLGYVRLHGRNYKHWFATKEQTAKHALGGNARYDYLYNKSELGEWAQKTQKIASEKQTTFVIQNNHPWGQAVANAIEMKAALGQTINELPDSLLSKFPRLIDL